MILVIIYVLSLYQFMYILFYIYFKHLIILFYYYLFLSTFINLYNSVLIYLFLNNWVRVFYTRKTLSFSSHKFNAFRRDIT